MESYDAVKLLLNDILTKRSNDMNFSVKCTENDILNGSRYFTVGKVYPVVNGSLMCDDGTEYNVSNFETVNDINDYFKNFAIDITFSLA